MHVCFDGKGDAHDFRISMEVILPMEQCPSSSILYIYLAKLKVALERALESASVNVVVTSPPLPIYAMAQLR